MPDARNPIEAIRRAAQHFADAAGHSKWNASVKPRDDCDDPCVLDYSTLQVLAENVDDVIQ